MAQNSPVGVFEPGWWKLWLVEFFARNMLGQNHQDSCLERFGTYIIHYAQLVRVSFEIHSWEAELMHMPPFPCMWCNVFLNQVSIAFSIILGNSPWKHFSTSNLAAIDSLYQWIFHSKNHHLPPSLHRGLMPSKILKLLIRRCLDCMASMVHWMWFPGHRSHELEKHFEPKRRVAKEKA